MFGNDFKMFCVDVEWQMVVQFSEPCSSCCEQPAVVQCEVDAFVRSFQQLSNEQISSAVTISRMDILNQVSQLVPCVGCRHRSITSPYTYHSIRMYHSDFCLYMYCCYYLVRSLGWYSIPKDLYFVCYIGVYFLFFQSLFALRSQNQ